VIKQLFGKLADILGVDITDALHKKLVRGGGGVFVLKVGESFFALIFSILLARILGPSEYGIFAYVMSIIGILKVPSALGFPTLILREIAFYKTDSNWQKLKGILKCGNFYVSLSSIILIILSLLTAPYILEETYLNVLYIALPILIFSSLITLNGNALRGYGKVVLGQIPGQLIRPVLFLLSLLLVYFTNYISLSPSLAMILQLISYLIAMIMVFYFLKEATPKIISEVAAKYDVKRWNKSLLPFLVISGTSVLKLNVDILFLGFLSTSADVGIYKIVVQGANLIYFIMVAINIAVAPVIAEQYKSNEMRKLQNTLVMISRVVTFLTIPLFLVLFFFGKGVLGLLFGAEYAAGAIALSILCVSALFNAITGPLPLILNMVELEKECLRGELVGVTINVLLNPIMIILLGINGAALATAISIVAGNLYWLYKLYSRTKLLPLAGLKIKK
jgi:O-antigen/teichoic acid export membrane protein